MKSSIKKIWGNEFVQGGVFLTISSFLVNILNYLFNLLIGRFLGPSGYGEVVALFSYMSVFSVPIMAISFVLIQKVGSKSTYRIEYAKSLESWFLNKLRRWSIVFFTLFVGTIPFVSRATNLNPLSSYFLIPLAFFGFLAAFYSALSQGLRLFLLFSVVSLIGIVIKFSGALPLIFKLGGLPIVLIFLLSSSIISYALYYYYFKCKLPVNSSRGVQKIERKALSILSQPQLIITFFSILGLTALSNVDIIFVKKFLSSYEAGIYSSWSLFAKMILYVLGPLASLGYVFFASNIDSDGQKKTLNISLVFLFIIAIASYVFYTNFATPLIILFFGVKFQGVSPYLGLASIFGSLYSAIAFVNNYFLAKKSLYSLILPLFFPFYLIGLFLIPRHIESVMTLTIGYSIVTLFVYFIAYLSSFFYNARDGHESH